MIAPKFFCGLMLPGLLALTACVPASSGTTAADAPPVVENLPALAWESGHPERTAWSAALRTAFHIRLAEIGVPADIGGYCPTFAALNDAGRVEALSTMAVAIARRESSYQPDQVYPEPPPLSVDSVGLFQLSYEDGFAWCQLDRASASLKDPVNNINCAVGEMARLVQRDGVVASGADVQGGKGLSRYWSVIQDGSAHKKSEIQSTVRALAICQC